METQELQAKIKELTQQIDSLTQEELRGYELQAEQQSHYSSQSRMFWPMFIFLIGFLGFTVAYFSTGFSILTYLTIFGVATPGVIWFMIAATRIPRWSRWREKEEAVNTLNQLYLEKRRLVRELRRLEVRGGRNGKSNGD